MAKFEIGNDVVYRNGQVVFAGTVIARGYVIDVETAKPMRGDEQLRYMVQQHGTGIIHVYPPRHLEKEE